MKPMRIAALPLLALVVVCGGCGQGSSPESPSPSPTNPGVLFDDFSYSDASALALHGWIVRSTVGWPGVTGAHWGEGSVVIVDDPAQAGNRILRMVAETDGTVAGTQEAQLCHQRKYLEGTYAARVRFADGPVSGPKLDQVVMSFYSISGYLGDLNPQYSELDWEYLPNGGWFGPGSSLSNTSGRRSASIRGSRSINTACCPARRPDGTRW